MQTLKNNNIVTVNNNNNNQLSKNQKRDSYLDVISNNILENRQTLKNPQEFYMGLFTNIVQKRINKRKRSHKINNRVNTKKFDGDDKSEAGNQKYAFDNSDERKVIKTMATRRQSAPNIVMKKNADH